MRYLSVSALILLATLLTWGQGKSSRSTYDFCAVQLFVADAIAGDPVVSAVAELIDQSGRVTQTEKILNGQAKFCDFGFGRYSIRIHDERSDCLSTEIKNVHVIYGHSQLIRAQLNSCSDEGDGGGNACFTYVRVTSTEGRPIKGAEITRGKGMDTHYTDSYGRVQLSVTAATQEDFS